MPETLVYVERFDDGEIIVGAFGDSPPKSELVGMLFLAATQFTSAEGETGRGIRHTDD